MGGIVFARATADDDTDIRRLLRGNPLGGRYGLTFEREPNAFAAPFEHAFVLARDDATGAAIGLYERTVWPCFVNGRIERVPYLGALRVAETHRHRIAIVRAGYASLRAEFTDSGDFPVALTSITSDNGAATRLLTAGLRGLPIYRPLAPFATFALRPRAGAGAAAKQATASDIPEIAAFLMAQNAAPQFAIAWDEARLRGIDRYGLRADDLLIVRRGGRIAGCIGLWDTAGFRQAVIRRYPPWMVKARSLLNFAAAVSGRPALPPLGVPIRQITLSHLAVVDDDPEVFDALLDTALVQTARRGFAAAILGMAAERGLAAIVRRRRRAIEYNTTLYTVHWPGDEEKLAGLKGSLPHPEIALL